MAVPAPELDDRRFQDLVDEAKRLIPQYCPEWTNHNLSDPGVALIELFAWMSEQVLYRLNQVPDRFFAKFLDLVGIDPFPPSAAETRLTFLLSAPVEEAVIVPIGTEVTTIGSDGDPVVFTTSADLVISQPELLAASTGDKSEERFVDAWQSLRYGAAPVRCFASNPLTPGDAFYLGFNQSLAGNVIQLTIGASIEGIGVDPAHAPLRWEVWSGEGWIRARVQEDTTGGLNRNGQVVLHVPLAHEPLTLGESRAHWLRARLLPPEEGAPWYQSSPQVSAVTVASLGGTTRGAHARRLGAEVLGRSDGGPGQRFEVRQPPMLPRLDDERVEVATSTGFEAWTEVDDFSRSGPGDEHVHIDGATGIVSFGPRIRYPNGTARQHGAIPTDGAEIRITGYRQGGGAIGNVGSGTLTGLRASIPFVTSVTNLDPATGGVDAESVANAKLRGPMSLRTGERAVTAGDYERLALEASAEVARARCLAPATPGGPVRLIVVPHARSTPRVHRLDDFALDDELVGTITAHLDERRVLGTTLEVGTPYYQGVTVAALLKEVPGRPATRIRERAIELLFQYVNPLSGGIDGLGWPFDTDINAATIAQMLESIDGVDRVEEVLLFEYDLRTGERHGVGRDQIRLDAHSLFLSAAHQVVVRQ